MTAFQVLQSLVKTIHPGETVNKIFRILIACQIPT